MFPVHRFRGAWRKSSLLARINVEKLTPTTLWWLWTCNCHKNHDVRLQQKQQNGAHSRQVTKKHKKARPFCQPVLDHFDEQYREELGDLWTSVRSALLDPHAWQYGVMVNRFTAETNLTQVLQSQGFFKFLPQTDVTKLRCGATSLVSNVKYHSAEDCVSLPRCISKCSPDDYRLQPDITSDSLSQDFESELSPSLPLSSLQCYIHPYPVRFPAQAHRPGQLKQYYLLNAASLLPVLALQVKDGEKVLDLCSAPGGKAVAIMQCATPALLCCNEPDPHRRDWLSKTLESFLPQSLSSRVIVSPQDGRCFGVRSATTYDKVLVDAPCSNDRSWLYSSSHQQGEQRLKERDRLPLLQAQLLRSALSAVRPGGVVVYSTCTLSSAENYAVVQTVLNEFPEAEPEDLWEEVAVPLSKYFAFGPARPDHGQTPYQPVSRPQKSAVSAGHHTLGLLVVPQLGKAWGPMFLSRIKRRK